MTTIAYRQGILAADTGVKRKPRPKTCIRCGDPATEQWKPNLCAIGNPKRWVHVCASCDVELNEMVVRFLFRDTFDDELVAYRAEKLA